jgi:hypothetical protein
VERFDVATVCAAYEDVYADAISRTTREVVAQA